MKAMVLNSICNLKETQTPLSLVDLPDPDPSENEIVVRVSACGVCHTELDEIEGRTQPSQFPIILGHQIVGRVVETGSRAKRFSMGDRVGVAWIHSACGKCLFCLEGNENLCEQFEATGRDANGGYAQYHLVQENFAYPIPEIFSDSEAAPLLCAGAVGYRSLRLTEIANGQNLGLIGFGASAHLVIQMARHRYPSSRIFVFARSETERTFAKELGAFWTGEIEEESPEKLHSAIDTTPVWMPVIGALQNLERGGRL
ncbi:MAG: alcohol dehydrogenase catalytic domain-containing protein, partial [Proteobacteria bacterium]|nr:alcohol dehydrogenase catalytic domain-containing protein [Pseudomonadota bacterium]